jgi:hypothetical protein
MTQCQWLNFELGGPLNFLVLGSKSFWLLDKSRTTEKLGDKSPRQGFYCISAALLTEQTHLCCGHVVAFSPDDSPDPAPWSLNTTNSTLMQVQAL